MADPSFTGACVYSYGGHVDPSLQALSPGVVLLGHDIWNDAVVIHRVCGTNPWLILRWMDLDINLHTPERAADFICAKAKALIALGIKCIAHGLNEQHTNRPRARAWELRFIERCHWHGVETLCSAYPFANFDDAEAQDFKDVWAESDYNGPHRYDLFRNGAFEPRLETSLRYRKWKNYPIWKDLCTEYGIEDGGWQRLGIPEEVMRERMLENVWLWKKDGALASTFFCIAHTDPLKWGSYYGTEALYRYWRDNGPSFEPGGNVPIPKELEEAQALCLKGQEIFGRSVTEVWEAKGDSIAQLFKQFGDIYNKIEDAKKALSPVTSSTTARLSQMDSGLTPRSPQNRGGPGH